LRGKNLALNGKRWVLRGVSTASATERLPRAWHEAAAAFISAGLDPDTLAESSQWGALAVVGVTQQGEDAAARLRELAHFPGAAIAIVSTLPPNFKKSEFAPNLLLAQHLHSSDSAVEPWTDLLAVLADEPDRLRAASSIDKPLLAIRPIRAPVPVVEARAACDVLQRDLAPIGQFAGYIV
jgi:hypothetical protein